MTTYRVGPAGATVLDAEGQAVVRLRPGYVVVEGVVDTAEAYGRHLDGQRKRLKEYRDKAIHVPEDKHVPSVAEGATR